MEKPAWKVASTAQFSGPKVNWHHWQGGKSDSASIYNSRQRRPGSTPSILGRHSTGTMKLPHFRFILLSALLWVSAGLWLPACSDTTPSPVAVPSATGKAQTLSDTTISGRAPEPQSSATTNPKISPPIGDIGTRWELFVDDWLIESMANTRLQLHQPVPQEVALKFDAPWEGAWSHYITMLQYGEEYRAYYRGWQPDGQAVTAVATSKDGIVWQRPKLGLFEWDGSRDNNIVWIGQASETFAPFLDTNPETPAAQRFKAVAALTIPGSKKQALYPFGSADGYHWQQLQQDPIITSGSFDSQNLAFWDGVRGRYVAFFRDFRNGVRTIKTATSPDFLNWTEPEWLDFGNTPAEDLYTNATVSYFRAPYLFLAFPMRFLPKRKVVLDHPEVGVSDAVFMSSRDGVHWDRRFLEAFLRPGRDQENWTERSNAIAWGLLPTAPDEISLYWIEHYRHPDAQLRRGTLRVDGFVSVHADYPLGEMITKSFVFRGQQMVLNYATSAAGSVRVEIQDMAGQPIPGYSLEDCIEMYGDFVDAPVRWRTNYAVSDLTGKPVRLRFQIKDADLYALQFRPLK
ncbi:MAG: hypothetical protein HY326_13115 [Chloroflexi bacterium]|nr:hypothetical protein [Chloroflexota bacterium]